MPVLSSFISYRPKRKTKPAATKVSSPFPVKGFNSPSSSSSHPYASPRIIDIHDGRALTSSPDIPEPNPYYSTTSTTSTPRVHLNVDITPEPLSDWFPSFLKQEPFTISLDGETVGASGSGTHYEYGNGREIVGSAKTNGNFPVPEAREGSTSEEEEEEEELETLSSAEGVLADLEAMDVRHYCYCDILLTNQFLGISLC